MQDMLHKDEQSCSSTATPLENSRHKSSAEYCKLFSANGQKGSVYLKKKPGFIFSGMNNASHPEARELAFHTRSELKYVRTGAGERNKNRSLAYLARMSK